MNRRSGRTWGGQTLWGDLSCPSGLGNCVSEIALVRPQRPSATELRRICTCPHADPVAGIVERLRVEPSRDSFGHGFVTHRVCLPGGCPRIRISNAIYGSRWQAVRVDGLQWGKQRAGLFDRDVQFARRPCGRLAANLQAACGLTAVVAEGAARGAIMKKLLQSAQVH